jgi:hypothetical protein
MDFFSTDATFLFHKTNTKRIAAISETGLKVSSPQSPVEQILEYWRKRHFPKKPSRLKSIFLVTTLNTFFKTDMSWFGELIVILSIKFSSKVLEGFRFYEYDHYDLMRIWKRVRPTIHRWYPDIWESAAVLTENEIKLLIGDYDRHQYYQLDTLLNQFWTKVQPWNKTYNDMRALYCHQNIPVDLIAYMIDVQKLVKRPWPKKRLVKEG